MSVILSLMSINLLIVLLLTATATTAQGGVNCNVQPSPVYSKCQIDLTVAIDMSIAMEDFNNIDVLIRSAENLLTKFAYGSNTEASVLTFGLINDNMVNGSNYFNNYSSLCQYVENARTQSHLYGLFTTELKDVLEFYQNSYVAHAYQQRVLILLTAIDDLTQVEAASQISDNLRNDEHVIIIAVAVGTTISGYLSIIASQVFVSPKYGIQSALVDEIANASCVYSGVTYPPVSPSAAVSTLSPSPLPTSPYANGGDGTLCAANPKNAWLDLVVVIEHSSVTFTQWSAISSSIVNMVSQLTLSNTRSSGHSSRIAIITYDFNGTVLRFDFTSEQTARNIQIALNNAKPLPTVGVKADIAAGLKAAKSYMTTNPSFRVPGVVLYAATYDSSGTTNPQNTADELKDHSIKIVTVSFDASNEVYAPNICALASPGLCLDAHTSLPQFGWAVSQLNCRCPNGWTQLVVNNNVSYADCFLYEGIVALQAYFPCPAGSDVLALASTPARVDFIGQLASKQNPTSAFSIGLLRTDANSQWTWQNEYLWSGYPSFAQEIKVSDVYGYFSKSNSSDWQLLADDGVSAGRHYVCQRRAADTDNIIF